MQAELRSQNIQSLGDAIYVPHEIFEKRTVTTATASAEHALTESFRPGEFLPALVSRTVSGQLGIRMIAGVGESVRIPRQGAVSVPQWYGETTDTTQSDITFLQPHEMTPKRISCGSSYTEMLLRQAGNGVPIASKITEDVMRQMSIAIDTALIVGGQVTAGEVVNVAESPNTGVLATITSSSALGGSAKSISYDDVLSLQLKTEEANAPMMRPGFLTHPAIIKKLKLTRLLTGSTDSVFVVGRDGTIDGYPTMATTIVPKNLKEKTTSPVNDASALIYSSDWSTLALCGWGNLQAIVDPYTDAGKASIRVYWHQFLDIEFLRQECFGHYDNLEAN